MIEVGSKVKLKLLFIKSLIEKIDSLLMNTSKLCKRLDCFESTVGNWFCAGMQSVSRRRYCCTVELREESSGAYNKIWVYLLYTYN